MFEINDEDFETFDLRKSNTSKNEKKYGYFLKKFIELFEELSSNIDKFDKESPFYNEDINSIKMTKLDLEDYWKNAENLYSDSYISDITDKEDYQDFVEGLFDDFEQMIEIANDYNILVKPYEKVLKQFEKLL